MSSVPPSIPTFLLYADDLKAPAAAPDFVHIETILARAGLHNWEIKPHRHLGLHQFLILRAGRARVHADGLGFEVEAPTLVAAPAGTVHGFAFDPHADGYVLTVADRFLEQCIQRGFERLAYPEAVTAFSLDAAPDQPILQAGFEFLHRELAWARPAQVRVTAAIIEIILVAIARRRVASARPAAGAGRRDLADRFKALVNEQAVHHWTVGQYADALGASAEQLTRACQAAGGRSPKRIIHDWLVAEAKRNLVYTAMSVQEVAFALGFTDPAYFTRFFDQRVGASPSQYREAAAIERTSN